MMKLKLYQVDSFTRRVFSGNPAAVCPLEQWLPDATLQAIALENNLSETAFFVAEGEGYRLRWFTPAAEVNLCGHATLAASHVLFEHLGYGKPHLLFATRSGTLKIERHNGLYSMDFPVMPPAPCATPAGLAEALGVEPVEVLSADDYIVVLASEAQVRQLNPDMMFLNQLELRGVCVTAPGTDVDFVSRFFAPRLGIPEDPVTGSTHCELMPYWARRLGKTTLRARQVSQRSGDLECTLAGDRVILSGNAVTFMEAEIRLDAVA